jgi:hypothetical protein
MKRSLFSILARLTAALGLIGIALWSLNLTIFHVWAADKFLSGSQARSDWHQKWATILFGVTLAAFIGAVALIWRLLFPRYAVPPASNQAADRAGNQSH